VPMNLWLKTLLLMRPAQCTELEAMTMVSNALQLSNVKTVLPMRIALFLIPIMNMELTSMVV
jgi:hypothetical protein